MSDIMALALLMIGTVASIYLAGWLAERRGRSFRIWAYIGVVIGPLALPLVFMFPNRHRKNGDHA